jgi:hypothetical protein
MCHLRDRIEESEVPDQINKQKCVQPVSKLHLKIFRIVIFITSINRNALLPFQSYNLKIFRM